MLAINFDNGISRGKIKRKIINSILNEINYDS